MGAIFVPVMPIQVRLGSKRYIVDGAADPRLLSKVGDLTPYPGL